MTRLDALKALIAKADALGLPTTKIITSRKAGRTVVWTSDEECDKCGC